MRPLYALALALAVATSACAGDAADDLPEVGTQTQELATQFGVGSLIIPMDTGFQDSGMLRAYGLVYRLLQNNVPVHWIALSTKADQGADFAIAAPAAVINRETGAAITLPATYRGGPFVIAAADRAAALPIVNAWLASDTVTVVHDVTAGSFTADVQKTMTAAPNLAVFQDGNEDIAFNDFNAAGIPDSAGLAWGNASVDLLTEAQIAGVAGGNPDGTLFQNGVRRYCHLTSMHYNIANQATTNEVVREVRVWLGSAASHAFMQCEAAITFENNVNGRYLSTAGIVDDGTRALTPINRVPGDLLSQYHGGLAIDTGSADSIGLAGGGFKANTRTLINENGQALTSRITWMTGFLDGDPTKGEVTYLAGHDYVVLGGSLPATPVSTNPLTNGVRLFLDSVFDAPCSSAAFQPAMTITKSAPATTAGNTITFTLAYQNTGGNSAVDTVITDTLPANTTFANATNGGTFAAGVVTWNLGAIAAGAMGQVSFTVNVAVDGTYQNTATLRYKAGTTPRTATSNTTTTVRDADVPVANNDAFTVAEDSSTALAVRANDTGLGDPPIVTVATDPPHGTVVVNANGSIQYTPDPDYNGPDSFTYTITDATNQSSMATVTITVTPVNDVPAAANDAFTVAEDSGATALAVRANDTGLGDAPITTTVVSDPPNGTAVINANGTVSYTPDPNFSGQDTFTYTIRDADGQVSTATVTVTVTPVNDTPVAVDDLVTVGEDSPPTAINVRANDTGVVDAPIVTVATDPPHGTVVVNPNGTISYTPDPNYSGPDSFQYTVTDADGEMSTATVTITVAPGNDTPLAVADTATVAEDSAAGVVIDVQANDTGLGDAPITTTVVSDPPHGTAVINAGGTVTYRPDPDYSGLDTFTYTIRDADGQVSTATVTVTVTPVNDVPAAVGDTVTTAEDTAVTITVQANDAGLGDGPITVSAVSDPPHGTVVINPDGTVTYTPDADYHGPDSFTYTVRDADGQVSTATVDVTVTPVDDVPSAQADTLIVAEDSPGVVVAVQANDTGLGDGPITTTAVSDPAHGTAVVNANGTVTYTPDPDYNGPDAFTYTIRDADGQLSTATVNVTVTPVDDLPDAIDDTVTAAVGAPTVIAVLANDTGLGDRPIVVTATDPPHGTVVVNPDGTVSYTPDAGYSGPDTFSYTIRDADGDTDSATVNVNVRPDRDHDGISDDDEVMIGTDPDDADSDDDGVLDGAEPDFDTDSDGDGLINALDPDSDDDGLFDGTESGVTVANADTDVGNGHFIPDADPATHTDPLDPDTDHGGVPDGAEDTDKDGAVDPGERNPLDPADDVVRPLDSDDDGLTDVEEGLIGTDPHDADSDDDGIIDGDEPNYTDDTDGDGLINPLDPDSDDDGIFDGTEVGITTPNPDTDTDNGHFIPDADPTTHTSAVDPDTDHGGIPDGAEDVDKDGRLDPGERDPLDPADDTVPLTDSDGDGLSDLDEERIGTDPQDADSDDDGVIDGAESNYTDDTDGDGLINPLDPDSDNDGIFDGTETGVTVPNADTDVGNGHFVPDADPSTTTGPLDPDTDDGGIRDGAEDFDHDGRVDAGEGDPNVRADDGGIRDDDHDGLSNGEEGVLGTDPLDADTDDDGVVDGDEANPSDDTDGDGTINPLDPDSDGDGILDGTEVGITEPNLDTDVGAGNFVPDRDPSDTTSMVNPDTDFGGIPDGEEDPDHDGQTDDGERDPNDPVDDVPLDTDGDGHVDPMDNCPVTANADQLDTDGDGMGDACDPDDDNDGLADGFGVSGGGCAAGGAGVGGLPVGLALVGLAALLARRRRAAARAALAGAVLGLGLAATPVAHAQVTADNSDFSIERFDLSSARGGILGVEGAGLTQPWDWDLHLWLGTANDPLVVFMTDADGHERVGSLVEQRTGGELGASIVIHERFGLALDAPLILAQRRDMVVPGVIGSLPEVGGVAFGDLRVSPKLRLLRQKHENVDLALVPEIILPTSSGDDYHGDAGIGFAPYVALSERLGRFRWAVNLGYAFRKRSTVGGLVIDNELRARAGLGVLVTRALELDLTLSAATSAAKPLDDFSRNHLEAVGGPVFALASRWQAFAAGGVGLREGYGTPDWRALVGLRVGVSTEGPIDYDHDGLIATDKCPRDPEDKDAFEDEDGCSDPDNDQDLVLDVNDGAPLDPEDRDGFEDLDGVPDADNDRDGLLDGVDACPLEPETANGFQDQDGCPDDPDTDGDGIVDRLDQCPTDPEDKDGVKDDDGCPEDNDGDGLLDLVDDCPMEAGPAENRGCPDRDRDADTVVDRVDNCPDEPGTVANHGCKEKQLAVLDNGRIEILDVVYFKTNKAVIQARSFPLLDAVANIIRNHPELAKITIEGHTDDRGNDAYNLDLSQRRAESVRRYLMAQGIPAARLDAKGYGEQRPIQANDTNAHRSANRRVEFKIEGVGSANSGPTTDTMDP